MCRSPRSELVGGTGYSVQIEGRRHAKRLDGWKCQGRILARRCVIRATRIIHPQRLHGGQSSGGIDRNEDRIRLQQRWCVRRACVRQGRELNRTVCHRGSLVEGMTSCIFRRF